MSSKLLEGVGLYIKDIFLVVHFLTNVMTLHNFCLWNKHYTAKTDWMLIKHLIASQIKTGWTFLWKVCLSSVPVINTHCCLIFSTVPESLTGSPHPCEAWRYSYKHNKGGLCSPLCFSVCLSRQRAVCSHTHSLCAALCRWCDEESAERCGRAHREPSFNNCSERALQGNASPWCASTRTHTMQSIQLYLTPQHVEPAIELGRHRQL